MPFQPGLAPLGLHIQLNDASGYGYSAPVAVPLAASAGVPARAFLPLSAFDRASWKGYNCRTCSLDTTTVKGLDIYVLYQQGPFEVRVREIAVVQAATDGPSVPTAPAVPELASPGAVTTLVEAAIRNGAFVWNKGYHGLCDVIYDSAARSILSAPGVSTAARG